MMAMEMGVGTDMALGKAGFVGNVSSEAQGDGGEKSQNAMAGV